MIDILFKMYSTYYIIPRALLLSLRLINRLYFKNTNLKLFFNFYYYRLLLILDYYYYKDIIYIKLLLILYLNLKN